jgi:hypothetical protein
MEPYCILESINICPEDMTPEMRKKLFDFLKHQHIHYTYEAY